MKRGQVWVETVIYTLIGLALIGVVLGLVLPKINQYRDKAVIEQSISSLAFIDSTINDARQAPGNRRLAEIALRKGNMYFNQVSETVVFELEDSKIIYTEPDLEVQNGRISVLTTRGSAGNNVKLTLNLDANMTFSVQGESLKFGPSGAPYKFFFENKGIDAEGKEIIEFSSSIYNL